MDVYEIRTNTKEILYRGGDYNLAVQSYYDFVEEAENDIDSKLFGLRIIGYVNGKKDNDLYEKGGKIKSGPKYKKGQALIKDDKIYRVISVLRDTNNDFHYRISSDRTDMLIAKENELKLAKDYHESKMRGADNEMNKLLIIDDYAKTESEIMRDDEIYEDDKKAEIYVKEVHSYIKRNNYPKRMSMSTFKELEKENKHLLNNTLALLGMYGPEMRKTYMEAYKESKNMYINPKVLKEKYNEKTYKEKIAILEMLKKDMEKDADVSKKDILKMEMKIDMLKDKTTTTFEKGGKVGYEININKLTLENIERATELEQDALMRGIDVRRSGNIVIIRDYDKIDDVIALLKYNLSFAYPQTKLSFKKGGTLTYKQKYNKKYGYPKNEGHSLKEISKDTGVSKKGLQQIYNKGVGAYKTNPQSVRPNVKSAEQWAQARVYSAVMGGKAAKVDAKELKLAKGGLIEAKEYFIDYGFIEDLRRDERYYVEILLKDNVSKKEVAEAKNYFYQTDNLYGDKKHYVDNLIKYRMRELYTFAKGGEVDLFDHYEKLPPKAKKIVDRYMKKYEEGDYNYEDSKKFLQEMEKAGYTFEYGLDNEPYDLRKMEKGGYVSVEEMRDYIEDLAETTDGEGLRQIAMSLEVGYNYNDYDADDEDDQDELYDEVEKAIKEASKSQLKKAISLLQEEFAKGGALSKEFKFDKNFVVYVPSTSDVSDKISPKELDDRVNEVKQYVANTFGGYTETETEGGYRTSKGDIVEEDVVKVSVFSQNKDWKDKEYEVVKKAKNWAKDWGQEAIGFEYEGDLYYIDGDGKMEKGGLMKAIQVDPNARELEPGETLPMHEGKTAELNQRSVIENIRELKKDPKTFWSEQMEGFKDNRQSAYRLVEDKKAKVNKYVTPEEQELIGAAITKKIKKSWGGTIDMPRGSGWGDYKKGERVLSIKDLKPLGKYLSYSKQFDAKNVVLILPDPDPFYNYGRILFMYINPDPNAPRTAEGRFGAEKRSIEDIPVSITEGDLRDNVQNWDLYKIKDYKYKEGGLTPKKAKKILEDGTAQGKPLTEKQKRYFGYMASQDKK